MGYQNACAKWLGATLIGLVAGLLAWSVFAAGNPVTGAAFTTVNAGVDGSGHCKNGNPAVNCNIYDGKEFVWLNGGPSVAYVGDGDYFFAVLEPGGQANPNDGSSQNLSDDFDAYTNRTFSVSGGTVQYSGSHDFDSNKIRLADYADTTNPGGVYILAVCFLGAGYPVNPSDCKYDAFKIVNAPPGTATVTACKFDDKNGDGSQGPSETLLAGWKIDGTGVVNGSGDTGSLNLSTDETGCVTFTVKDLGGPVTLEEELQSGWIQTAPLSDTSDYTVDNGVVTIRPLIAGDAVTVYFGNTNLSEEGAVTAVKTAVPNAAYTWGITKAVDKTLVKQVGGSATFNYTVNVSHDGGVWTLAGTITINSSFIFDITGVKVVDAPGHLGTCTITPPAGNGTNDSDGNVVGLTIPHQTVAMQLPYTCTFDPANVNATTTGKNEVSVQLADGTEIAFDEEDYTFVGNVKDDCVAVTDSYGGSLGLACVGDANPTSFTYSRTVNVPQFGCQTYNNTAMFTTNTTGTTGSASKQVQVCGPVQTGALTMGFWQNNNGQNIIKGGASTSNVCNSGTWLRQYAPFQDLSATATCTQVATYVYNVIKAAACTSSSSTCNAMLKAQMLATALDVYFSNPALGGNKISAPAPIGGVSVDLTKICTNIPTCSSFEDDSGVFGATSLTVSQILASAAGQSNVGGSVWYAQVKATQVRAKDVFDAINNQVVFGP